MPFAGYSSFDACTRENSDKQDPSAYCAAIKRQVEGKLGETVHFQNVGGDPFEDQDTLEDFLDALNEVADEVRIGDETWPSDDYAIHDCPVEVQGCDPEIVEEIWEEFSDEAVALGGPSVKGPEPTHIEEFKLNEAELFELSEKTDEWSMEDGMWVNEKSGHIVYTPEATFKGGNPGGNAPETGKQDALQLLKVIGQDGDLDGELIGVGVDFPNSGVYVDWLSDKWPEEEQIGPHVSDYETVADLEQATGNLVEMADNVHVEELEESSDTKADSDDPAEPGEESVDTTESDDTTTDGETDEKSVTIKGLSDEALETIERKWNVEVEQ